MDYRWECFGNDTAYFKKDFKMTYKPSLSNQKNTSAVLLLMVVQVQGIFFNFQPNVF